MSARSRSTSRRSTPSGPDMDDHSEAAAPAEQREAGPPRARRGAGGAESCRGDRRDRDVIGAGLRRRDRGGGSPPRRRCREPRSLRPGPDEGVIVGKWSEPGVRIPGAGTIVSIQDGSALSKVARTGTPARQATDDPGVPAELRGRLIELGVTSLVARSDRRVGAHLGRRRGVAHRRAAVRCERRGAAGEVRRPRRGRAREHPGPRGARHAGRRAGRPHPRRGRGRDRGGPGAALQRRLGGARPAVRRAGRCNRALPRSCRRRRDRGRLGARRPARRRPARRTRSGTRAAQSRESRKRAEQPGSTWRTRHPTSRSTWSRQR